jgi:carboxymethylenebutenolidase
VVLVISEIFGVHEHIADVARRFAHQGYCAIAPDLFKRQGNPAGYTDIGALMSELVSKVPDAQVMGDLDATVAWARARARTPHAWASPASAGAGASPGCSPSTARR